jgi:hypothetical protein
MNAHLAFLLSVNFDSTPFHPDHQADWDRSGLTEATRVTHKVRTVPPDLFDPLAGFRVPPAVTSMYIIPFPDPNGGVFDHVKLKLFPTLEALRGDEVTETRQKWRYNGGATKYFTRKESPPRLFFPLPTITARMGGDAPLWIVEGEKKALAAAQIGLPAIGIESAWGWCRKGTRELLPDFALIPLAGRIIELVPDGDVHTNPAIKASMRRLADTLRDAGARPRLVRLPEMVTR